MTQVESYSPRRARRAAQPGPDLPTTTGLPPAQRSAEPVADTDLRGRHATSIGQGFGWVVAWTIVAALVPGAGLIAAGWRRLGSFLLGLQILGGLALAGLALSGGALKQGIGIAISPTKLLLVALAATCGGLLWVLFLVLTNTQLRRYASLSRPQKLFSGVLVLALIVGIGLPAYKVGSYAMLTRGALGTVLTAHGTGTAPSRTAVDPWADTPRMNVLLVGSDAGNDREGVRTDSLILASVNTHTGNSVMFSLPRNLVGARFRNGSPGQRRWPNGFSCPSGGGDQCMINAVWTWATGPDGAQYYKGKHAGINATEDVVAGTLGIPVDNYVLLSIQGLVDFVDAIGGVRVNVYQDLPRGGHRDATPDMGAYYLEATQGYLKKGMHKKLDGYNAMWFARARRGTTDYDRMRRQRCLIAAISEQASPARLALGFPEIIKAIKKNMQTSIGQSDLSAWVTLAQRIQGGKTTSLAFTDEVINSGDPDYDLIQRKVGKEIAKSDKAAAAKPSASAVPSAGASPSASPTASTGKKKNLDPTKAQDVKAVC